MSDGRKIYTNGARDIVHLQTKPGLQLQAHDRSQVDAKGQLMIELIKILAHGGVYDGETSSGEPKMRLLTAGEAADKAADLVKAAWLHIANNRWCVDTAPASELFDDLDNASQPAGFRQ